MAGAAFLLRVGVLERLGFARLRVGVFDRLFDGMAVPLCCGAGGGAVFVALSSWVVSYTYCLAPLFPAGFRFFPGGQAMALPATQNPLGRGAGQAKAKPGGRGAGRQAAGGLRNCNRLCCSC